MVDKDRIALFYQLSQKMVRHLCIGAAQRGCLTGAASGNRSRGEGHREQAARYETTPKAHCQCPSRFLFNCAWRHLCNNFVVSIQVQNMFNRNSLSRVWSFDHLDKINEYISIGWIDTVKAFSIFMPSYINESDTWLTEVLYRRGKMSSKLTFPPLVWQVRPTGL